MINDVQEVLDLLTKDEGEECFKDRKGKRRRDSYDKAAEQKREVKRIKGLLTVSNSVAINSKGEYKIS